jgi:hypothetical protein
MAAATSDKAPLFEGDALAFFQTLYKDTSLPTEVRLTAAKFAVQFERPALLKPEDRGASASVCPFWYSLAGSFI